MSRTGNNSSPHRPRQEEGFLLLGVLFLLLVVMITLALAAPKIAESIRRDKEVETMHRGLQYARAIRMFYTKNGRYPSSMDQLMKTDNQRYLRKRYLNPMTGKDDWRLIHLGEAKVPAMGLFGQPLQQAGGITPTGASTGIGSTNQTGSSSSIGSSNSSLGGSSSSGSTFGSSKRVVIRLIGFFVWKLRLHIW